MADEFDPDLAEMERQLLAAQVAQAQAQPQFSAGTADFAPRSELAPFTEDPRAMARAAMGVAGIPGLATAGLGALGTIARGVNAMPMVERLFSGSTIPGLLGGMVGVGSAAAGEVPTANALRLPRGVTGDQILNDMTALDATAFRAKYNMLPEDAMNAWQDRMTRNPPFWKRPFVTHPDDLPRKPGPQSGLEGAAFAARERPSGAGARRDKILRDAEDAATKTG